MRYWVHTFAGIDKALRGVEDGEAGQVRDLSDHQPPTGNTWLGPSVGTQECHPRSAPILGAP